MMWEYIVKAVFALIVIGFLIYATYLMAERLKKNTGFAKGRYIKVIERVPLGQDKALAVAKIGDKSYVLGICQSSITLLTEIETLQEPQLEANSPQKSFADCLKMQLQALTQKHMAGGASGHE